MTLERRKRVTAPWNDVPSLTAFKCEYESQKANNEKIVQGGAGPKRKVAVCVSNYRSVL
jgi:hypothetical protein